MEQKGYDDRMARAQEFLVSEIPEWPSVDVDIRLAWAKADQVKVIEFLEREKNRYRVYKAVGNVEAMQRCEGLVADLLKDFDAWAEVIAELEAERQRQNAPQRQCEC